MLVRDLDREFPAVRYIVGNKAAGKTTAILRHCLEDAVNEKNISRETSRFALLYRVKGDLEGSSKIFDDVITFMRKDDILTEEQTEITLVKKSDGLYLELYLADYLVGYAVCIKDRDRLKKYSPAFRGITNLFFDEFISEDGKYLPQEPEKLYGTITCLLRGGGDRMRQANLFMAANNISLINPYFIGLDVLTRVREGTHFLRGHGWVIEFIQDENARKEIESNRLLTAFSGLIPEYGQYTTGKSYMINDNAFIQKPSGRSYYICTFVHSGKEYGVREYYENGYYHVGTKPDPSCPYIYVLNERDHKQNRVMLQRASSLWSGIRDAFDEGRLRFENADCKAFIYEMIGVDAYK